MKRINYTIDDVTGEEGQKRLDHYNQWLLDPKRVSGTVYPGYPQEKKARTSRKVTAETVDKKTKRNYNQRIVTKILKGNMMTKVTNLSRATDIVKASANKAEAIAKIVETLSVTKSNAFVYYTKAFKILNPGDSAPVKTKVSAEKSEKTEVKTKKTVSKVTEISPEKHKQKVGEIDKVIASLKGKPATPFSGLTA